MQRLFCLAGDEKLKALLVSVDKQITNMIVFKD
jgi:hypothetical protein